MNRSLRTALIAVAVISLCLGSLTAAPTMITYQGRVTNSGGDPLPNGTYNFVFTVYDAPSGGAVLWTESRPGLPVTNGLVSVLLGSINPLTDPAFAGDSSWLEVTIGAEVMNPRVRLVSVPYSHRVSTIDGARGGHVSGAITITPDQLKAAGDGIIIYNINGDTAVAIRAAQSGLIGSIDFYDPVDSKDGRMVQTKKVHIDHTGVSLFGATTADTTLKMFPSGDIQSVGQIAVGQNSTGALWSTVFGYNNTASGDSATVSGGYNNIATDYVAVVGGGSWNQATGKWSTVGGGGFNKAELYTSTVGGGAYNEAKDTASAVGGGNVNIAQGAGTFIGGGTSNTADSAFSTIGGGAGNITAGYAATVPGGSFNQATGKASFAAGTQAYAVHNGSFVWADTTPGGFSSVNSNEFAVRAGNGVRTTANNASYGASFVNSGNGDGVRAYGNTSNGVLWAALYAYNVGTGSGIYATSTGGPAAYLAGNVTVTGTLSKGAGSFKIDHPLDPEGRYLYHSFVESPDMKNVYDGVVTLDGQGEATVTMPEYFEALNRDYRYQLTCIGGFAQVYIEKEVSGGTFVIAGGRPGLKVSWQVTGIRKDAYANAHRIPVEEEKPLAERGRYLHPDAFGLDPSRGIGSAARPMPPAEPGNVVTARRTLPANVADGILLPRD